MKTLTPPGVRADLVFAAVTAAVFTGAIILTIGWPDRVALLPRLAAAVGALASLYFIVRAAIGSARERRAPKSLDSDTSVASAASVSKMHPEHADPDDADNGDDEDDADDDSEDNVEYVFATVGRRAWISAVGWIAGFFILLSLFGIFISAGVFALTYLRVVGSKSWLFSTLYAGILTTALFVLIRVVTYVPSPPGMILPGW